MRFDLVPAEDLVQAKLPGTAFQFSNIKIEKLGSSEYTLVTIVMDTSGSISSYQSNLVTMLNTIVDACKKSPRAENLLLRVLTFNDDVNELHGFIPLQNIIQYQSNDLACTGCTALYDAIYSAVMATKLFGENLADQDYDVNAVIYITTDGEDNKSSFTPSKIASEIENIQKNEKIESLTTVLIGMGDAPSLDTLKNDGKLTQVVDMGNITPGKLAKLANWTSKSISSSSQSLGTGSAAPIPSLTF